MILRVIYVIQDQNTINHLTDYRDKHIDSPTKINFALYNMVCDMLNCTQIRIFTDDWGFEIFNKTLNRTVFRHGMFEDLMNDKADIAGTVAFMPASRLSYFKYLFAPIKDFSLHFVFKAPPLAFYSNIVVLPFDTLVWLTIGAVLVFCGILINTIFHWEVKQKKFAKELAIYKENEPSLLDVVMMQIAVVCQIDFYYEPKSLSGKITTFTLLIFCTFIYTAFSARIVLLLQSNTNMINSLDTLYATNFEFGVESQSYNKRYFREFSDRADENWRKKIYENKINKRGVEKFFDAEVGMRMVRDSYFTFHIEQTVANHLIQKLFSNTQKCALKFIETIYKPDNPHLSLPRNSPYIEFFAVSFNRLAETGLHNREYRNCFTKRPSCEGRSNTFVSVGLTESYFAFLVFGVGVCTSIILLIIECLVFKYLKK
ncbi:ionotropic receptor 75a-like [Anthonomus grandis grandis]|uniref:ionotropic receptor 75a-like n=1 Tax=Anthonomus grandis grandis TaxID=2921223 RepID=UPI002165845F|nr:ionotropic receptor 75a-like [Anthonomus grandis grandis]